MKLTVRLRDELRSVVADSLYSFSTSSTPGAARNTTYGWNSAELYSVFSDTGLQSSTQTFPERITERIESSFVPADGAAVIGNGQ